MAQVGAVNALTWTVPVTYPDVVSGFYVGCSGAPGVHDNLLDVGKVFNAGSAELAQILTTGPNYCIVAAYDSAGRTSWDSSEAVIVNGTPGLPNLPVGERISIN